MGDQKMKKAIRIGVGGPVGSGKTMLISAGLFTLSAEFGKLASTGFCGGLTTFSSFADGIVNLFDASQVAVGLLYIALNMLLGLLAVYLGLKVVLKTKFSDFAN